MGAAWGTSCAKCPQKGTQAYKQMCGSGVPGMMVDPVTGVTHEIDECQMMPGTVLAPIKAAVTIQKLFFEPQGYHIKNE